MNVAQKGTREDRRKESIVYRRERITANSSWVDTKKELQ
jgi:hypothetical protein